MDVWICSYGGSGTNMLADYLSGKINPATGRKFVVRTPIWEKLVAHHGTPLEIPPPTNLKAIYLFDDPRRAFLSMKLRGSGYFDLNCKKLNNETEIVVSDYVMMSSMLHQFDNWTGTWTGKVWTNIPILTVKFADIFDVGKHAIGSYLNIDVSDFPHPQPRQTDNHPELGNLDLGIFDLFPRQIEHINSYSPARLTLPSSTFTEI